MDQQIKGRLFQRIAIIGCALGAGFALGAYLSGQTRLIAVGLAIALVIPAPSFLLAQYNARVKPNWDPLSPYAGVRLIYMTVAMFIGGLTISWGLGQFLTLLRTHEPFPAPSLMQLGLAGIFIGQGLWWLSWPAQDPHYGKYRWLGWAHLGVAGFMATLLVVVRVAFH